MPKIEVLAVRNHDENCMTVCLKPRVPFIITPSIVNEIRLLQNKIAEEYYARPWEGVYYLLWYLHSGKIPWKGFDFKYIHDCLKSNHEDKIEDYIEKTFELLFINYVGFDLPLISCSLANRKLSGMSQEFFYLNRINFIKEFDSFSYSRSHDLIYVPLDFNTEVKKPSFPSEIYLRNSFYKFNAVNLAAMRNIISSHTYTPIPRDELNQIKLIFDAEKTNTLNKIYHLASEKISLIERFSLIQSFEHLQHKMR